MVKPNTSTIKNIIEKKYISLESPNYEFIETAEKNRVYKEIFNWISSDYTVEDLTDRNYDVCFSYLLKNGGQDLSIELSLVGPYFILLRLFKFSKNELVEKENCSKSEHQLISEIEKFNFTLLTKNLLETPLKMKLYCTDNENVKIYQALFSDSDYLPWE